jgi:hypothetical protein
MSDSGTSNDALSPTFKVGDKVRVRQARGPGHIRSPLYCRGKAGEVVLYVGAFPNPEELSLGRPGLPKKPLYRVRFRQVDLWPDYQGSPRDTVDIEIYQHWLITNEESVHAA